MANELKNKNEFKKEFQRGIIERCGRSFEQAHITEKYMILGEMVRDYASIHWNANKNVVSEKQEKQMYYFSMELLMGRLLTNNLTNLGIYEITKEGLAKLGQDINELENLGSGAGLGNGSLGHLAARFLDSLASLNLVGHGSCIRYKYGLFKQKIISNEQVEVPDQWLSLGNAWGVREPKHAVNINFGGHVDMWMGEDGKAIVNHVPSLIVCAVPYDIPTAGQNINLTNALRLWSTEVTGDTCDMSSLNEYVNEVREICRNVYPDDSTEHGKALRLKQQYFFVAAGLNSIIESHMFTYHTLDNFSEKVAIQLNDTHPVLCIPELMRILMDDYKYDWDQTWDITKNTIAYTNHTALNEALEKWPIQYVQDLLSRAFMIIEGIGRRFKHEVSHDMGRSDLMNEYCVLKDGQVHMANLAIISPHSVNGVAALHAKILKEDVMKNFHDICPNKFSSKANGITHRRWLLYPNPQLSNLLEKTIGPDFKVNPEHLQDLMKYVDDRDLQKEFMDVKIERKKILVAYIKDTLYINIDVNSVFDVQVKHLHAYKRQLLNVMNIIDLYFRMKQDPSFRIYPRTFIFAAKAASGYTFAKKAIKLIHCMADKVNNDSDVSSYMKVVFIPNYDVNIAEILMNAAGVSEQISTTGKEASGTGNMKFMMNGAITLGIINGANVETVEKVGYDHAEIFGLRAGDVALVKHENTYDVWWRYNENANIQKVVNSFVDSTFSDGPKDFKQIYNELMFKDDEYLLLADFEAYSHAQKNIEECYRNKEEWVKTCPINIAQSGYFSSDCTVKQYADEIWNIESVNMK